jgi:surfeit locus 1 family protein
MTRKIPILPTIFVLTAVAVMVALGVWQLQRAKWKEGVLAQYAAAEKLPPIAFPSSPLTDAQLPLYRYATGVCLRPTSKRAQAGENREGEPGYVQIVDCVTGAEGPGMSVELGWSKNPNAPFKWTGGPVSGIIVRDSKMRMRLVAETAPPGLQPSAKPDAKSASAITPGGHRGYAATWFALAATALIIYLLAMAKRRKKEGSK